MKTCILCKGMGSMYVMYKHKSEWYSCRACMRNGCRDASRDATIQISKAQQKYCKQLPNQQGEE